MDENEIITPEVLDDGFESKKERASNKNKPIEKFGFIGFRLGLWGLISAFVPFLLPVSINLAIAAIVFASIGRKRAVRYHGRFENTHHAQTGLTLGIVACVVSILSYFVFIFAMVIIGM